MPNSLNYIYTVTPFGVLLKSREFTSNQYRYGFNGMEKENEVKGNGNSYDFGARIYDNRLGRWLSLDPIYSTYPEFSPYNFSLNSPLQYFDDTGQGVNGGFSVVNNSKTQSIKIVGSGKIVARMYGGSSPGVVSGETTPKELTLNPGDRFEARRWAETIKEGDKYTVYEYWDGVIIRADGTKEVVDVYDVDFIKIQDNQTFEIEGEGNFTNKNTEPKEEWYDQGEIKLQSSYLDAIITGGSENEAQVVISDSGAISGKPKLNITTEGDYFNQPTVIAGDSK